MMEEKEKVRLLLKQAFMDIDKEEINVISHKECVELREDLCLMPYTDLIVYLPKVCMLRERLFALSNLNHATKFPQQNALPEEKGSAILPCRG